MECSWDGILPLNFCWFGQAVRGTKVLQARRYIHMKSDPRSWEPSRPEAVSKAYVAPAATRLSPEEAKDVLLRQADLSDPNVRLMLERIDMILGDKTVH